MKESTIMKKVFALILALSLVLASSLALADKITIAVPNDATNEGRALLLLQQYGVLTLNEEAGILATGKDIVSSKVEIELYEVEAANVPNVKDDVDYAIINSNYALDAGFNPTQDALLLEKESPYANVLSVKDGNQDTDEAKALAAALTSAKVKEYIEATYEGAVISAVEEPGDGFDPTVDYAALAGKTITVAASPTPHAQILAVAAEILAEKDIKLEVIEFSDYVVPNTSVEDGEIFANYFAHVPYQENFNAENGTHLVNVAAIHVEPMGLYGGKQADVSALGIE